MPSTLTLIRSTEKTEVYAAEPRAVCHIMDWTIFVLLCAVLIFGPLAFGAVTAWGASGLHVGSAMLLVLWAVRQVLAGNIALEKNPVLIPALVFGTIIVIQLIARIPAYPYATMTGALNLVAYFALMFVASQLLPKEKFLRRFMLVMTIFGFLLAVFGAAQSSSSSGLIYWTIKPRQSGWVFGPYVNHNHYAGLMELLIPIPLVRAIMTISPGKRVLFGFAAAIMVATVAMSQSRGGMIAVLCEICLIGVAVLLNRRNAKPMIALAVVLIGMTGTLIWMAGTSVSERINDSKQDLERTEDVFARVMIVKDSVAMIKERPSLGWGYRMFPVTYPEFRTFYTNFYVNEAHNEYVQVLVEMGIVGFGVVMWFIWISLRRGLRNISQWHSGRTAGLRLAAVTACAGILVHSFSDFNLQIPGNAALFFVMCVIAAGTDASAQPESAYYPIKQRLRPQAH